VLRSDLGSGSLLVAWGCVLTVLVALAGCVLSSAFVVRTRVAAAADLGALAAASAALEQNSIACNRAGAIVRANGATMVACRVEGTRAMVEVMSPAPSAVAWVTGGRAVHISGRAQAELVALEDP
jgi:secretion/DNA translocation related TadE-like protein